MRRRVQRSAAALLVAVACALAATPTFSKTIAVPLRLENNRPYIDVRVLGAGGRPVRGHFYLDTGGGALVVSKGFAQRAKLVPAGPAIKDGGVTLMPIQLPKFFLGGAPVSVAGVAGYVAERRAGGLQGTDADGVIPVRALRQYVVTLDFAGRRFRLSERGAAEDGRLVPGTVTKVGMPVVEAVIAGHRYGFLLDTGATYSMLDEDLLADLERAHPSWLHRIGPIGPADMLIGPDEVGAPMLRLGEVSLGAFTLLGVGVIGRPGATYRGFMSRMLGTRVVGSLGDNVWRNYTVTVDFPNGQIRIKGAYRLEVPRMGYPPLTFEPAGRSYRIAFAGAQCHGLQIGDRLIAAGGVRLDGATLARLLETLSGPPGAVLDLKLKRGGATLAASCRRVALP
ncbi:MAG: hypothetical protein ACP5QR_09880 [Rhizomicrobium sp.]